MSSLNAKNISFKRRAIYTGLFPFLEFDNLIRGMLLWEQRYADSPSFAVQHFVNDICTVNHLEHARREMLLNLVKTLALPEQELMRDPADDMAVFKKRHNINTASVTSEYTSKELLVFQKLIVSLLEQVNVDVRVSVKEFVLQQLQRQGKIDDGLKRQLQLWLSRQVPSMKIPMPDIESLRKIINFFYVGYCEYLGPVEADRLLGRSVAKITDNQTNPDTAIMRKLL